uniref:Uncharacterized protein n=2 Tax=Candidatus Bipolaricaulota TaxID=67810 RepID=H5SP52_9BACT|nr:hypothetical protein HGMM_F53C10C12 [uncultured Acetothermia bacterium]BAL58552.1 hypothetical protein HGMM_OP2C102 [Candidatus Acetothermum autotrophicum]
MACFRRWRQAFHGNGSRSDHVASQQSLYGVGTIYTAGRRNRHVWKFRITVKQTRLLKAFPPSLTTSAHLLKIT